RPTAGFLFPPAILVPLALVLAYAAGSECFRSPFGGFAFVLAQVAYFGFFRPDTGAGGTGRFETLTQPQSATLMLVATAVIALAVAFMRGGGLLPLACLAQASFALTAIHASYTPILIFVLAGFLVARMILIRGWEPLLPRGGAAPGHQRGGGVHSLGCISAARNEPVRRARFACRRLDHHEPGRDRPSGNAGCRRSPGRAPRDVGQQPLVGRSRRRWDASRPGDLGEPTGIHNGCGPAVAFSSAPHSAVPSHSIRNCRGVHTAHPFPGARCSRRRRPRRRSRALVPGDVYVCVLRRGAGMDRLGRSRRRVGSPCDRSVRAP